MNNFNYPERIVKAFNTTASDYVYYNATINEGRFINGFGFNKISLPGDLGLPGLERELRFDNDAPQDLWFYSYYDHINNNRSNRIVYYTADGKLKEFEVISLVSYPPQISLSVENLESRPVAVNYRYQNKDYMLFSNQKYFISYTPQELPVCKQERVPFIAMETCYGLLFAILEGSRNSIYYTDDFDPTTLESTYTVLDLTDERGLLTTLLNFNDDLYIFREYGITKLSKFSSYNEFTINNLFSSGSKIYGKTVAKCGDNVVFLTKEGLHVFDGNSTRMLDNFANGLLQNVDNDNASACFIGNKYFLACRLDFNDDYKSGCELEENFINNALISVDIETNEVTIMRGVDICSMLAVNEQIVSTILATFNGSHNLTPGMLTSSNAVFNTKLTAYCVLETDFDLPDVVKNIYEIKIKTLYDCEIKIISEEDEKVYNIKGNKRSQSLKVLAQGTRFKVIIKSANGINLTPPNFKVEYYAEN